MNTNKSPTLTIALLITICIGVLVWSVWQRSAWGFWGIQVWLLFTLFSLWAAQINHKWVFRKFLIYSNQFWSLVCGLPFLISAYWPIKLLDQELLLVFLCAGGLAWVYSYLFIRLDSTLEQSYQWYKYLPMFVLVALLSSIVQIAGSKVAASLLDFFYVILAVLLIRESLADLKQVKFNLGLLLFAVATAASVVEFKFSLYWSVQDMWLLLLALFIGLNLWFNLRKKKRRRRKK